MARDVQQSMFPDLKQPVNVGPLVPSVIHGNNADLIAAIAPLYLAGRQVLDVTFGEGKWWKRYRPDQFTFHDLKLDGVDFTELPYPAQSFEVVCYDPPYMTYGGSTRLSRHRNDFGIAVKRNHEQVADLMLSGLGEVLRVASELVLAKSMRFTSGTGGLFHGPFLMAAEAQRCGWVIHDHIIHHSGPMPGNGWNISNQVRTIVQHSDLLVFRRPR
jgi:hypothetical protein